MTQNNAQDTPLILATKHARSVDRLDWAADNDDISFKVIEILVDCGKFWSYYKYAPKCMYEYTE